MTDGLTASDVALLSGNNGNNNSGWGGDWMGLLALFFLFSMFGWGGFGGWGGGFGGNGGGFQGALTRGELCQDMNFQSLENATRGIQQGLCDGFYAQNNAINGLGMNVMQGFQQAELSRCNQQSAIMQQLTTMMFNAQQCCCDVRGDIKDLMYAGAKNTCDVIQSTHNDTDRVIARLDQMEANRQAERIHALELENQKLSFQASQTAQNAFITANQEAQTAELIRRLGRDYPVNAVVVQPNTPVTFPTNGCGLFNGNYNNGCGCNSGCGNGCGCGNF